MFHFKKISVCHGKSCGSAGAPRIKKILEENYKKDVEIVVRECCGRCERSCTIVIDNQPISNLSPNNLKNKFLDNPKQAIIDAQKLDCVENNALENILSDDFLSNSL